MLGFGGHKSFRRGRCGNLFVVWFWGTSVATACLFRHYFWKSLGFRGLGFDSLGLKIQEFG